MAGHTFYSGLVLKFFSPKLHLIIVFFVKAEQEGSLQFDKYVSASLPSKLRQAYMRCFKYYKIQNNVRIQNRALREESRLDEMDLEVRTDF